MSDEKVVKERDAVKRERAAFAAGALAYSTMDHTKRDPSDDCEACARVRDDGAKRYPLPELTRPRIRVDEFESAWKFEDGKFWVSLSAVVGRVEWVKANSADCLHEVTPDRVTMWADLLANPTEQAEAE